MAVKMVEVLIGISNTRKFLQTERKKFTKHKYRANRLMAVEMVEFLIGISNTRGQLQTQKKNIVYKTQNRANRLMTVEMLEWCF